MWHRGSVSEDFVLTGALDAEVGLSKPGVLLRSELDAQAGGGADVLRRLEAVREAGIDV
jgi:hypothetical protein